ncbi:MAG: HAMP domain-containing protein [Caldilineaceae bacterium]
MNTSEIFSPLRRLIVQVSLIALGVLILATLVSILIARTLVNPIRQLVDATHAVGSGDLSVSVASARQDEIGTLARSFSDMVINLDRHQQQLKAVNEIAAGILGRDLVRMH